jgi:glutaredoxin
MIIIYSISNCKYCDLAKDLLKNVKETIYINCDIMISLNREEFKKSMRNKIGREWKTFPMIFHDDIFIGGYDELCYFLAFNDEIREYYMIDDADNF